MSSAWPLTTAWLGLALPGLRSGVVIVVGPCQLALVFIDASACLQHGAACSERVWVACQCAARLWLGNRLFMWLTVQRLVLALKRRFVMCSGTAACCARLSKGSAGR